MKTSLHEVLDTDIFAALKKMQKALDKKINAIIVPEYKSIEIVKEVNILI